MEQINEQNLQELGIFEIRNIAREIGVYSPTTQKKQELIEKIMRIVNGSEKPYVKKTRQGRPPKNITTINDFIEVIVPQKTLEQRNSTDYSVFNDNAKNINFDDLNANEYCFKGLVKVYDGNDYSLCFLSKINETQKDIVFINNVQTDFYNLKTGDEISGKYVFVDENKPFILKEIFSINGNAFTQDFKRKTSYFNLIAKNPCQKLKTNIYSNDDEIYKDIDLFSPIAKGQRILIKSTLNNQFNGNILHRLSTGENNLKSLVVLIDETPENYYEFCSNSNFDVVSNNYDKCENFDLELDVKLERILRSVEEGSDEVIYINDIKKLQKYFENNFIMQKYSLNESIVMAENKIKNLILLGKFTENNGSLTLIAGTDCENSEKFENLFNNKICYSYSKYQFVLDKNACKTLNIDKILTKSEFNKLKNAINN